MHNEREKGAEKVQERTLRILEFDKILARLAEYATSALGRQEVLALRPMLERSRIAQALQETSEAKSLLSAQGRLPMGGIHDIRETVSTAAMGRTLAPEELMRVGQTLEAIDNLRDFFRDREEEAPALYALVNELQPFPRILKAITQAIGPGGEVLDEASPKLHSLRTQMRTLHNRIKDRLDDIIKGENQKYLQESLVTLRNGRYVIPVKQEYKAQFPGIVHDQSASGATLFIEPMVVVEINNQLRQVEAEEEQEIYRILTQLSAMVGAEAVAFRANLDLLARLDLTVAKARMSIAYDGTEPLLNEQGIIRLRGARHPLLTGNVVPVDLELGDSFHTLVITGPNTGGKTVNLKTTGLLVLMAQAGLHIPARYDSEIAIFSGIYSDIGDEQSIEQSLSTFSAHMTQIVAVLQAAEGPKDLVLLDELGAGTDPAEGAALAMAILKTLHERGVRTIATTHYSELKAFAYNTAGMQNASVEFDLTTLRPTYRLLLGIPGESNAFAIAARLGLESSIINQARAILSPEQLYVEELIGRITAERKTLEQDRHEASVLRSRLEKQEKEHRDELERLRAERQKYLRQAKEEAQELVKETRRQMEELLRELREAAPEQRNRLAQARRRELAARLEQLAETDRVEEETGSVATDEIQIGGKVEVTHLGQTGDVLAIDGDQIQVGVGSLKIWVDRRRLRPLGDGREQKAAVSIGELGREKAQTIHTELDLRGLPVDEALMEVDKYLDAAFLAGVPSVRLIHGKGTGALRKAIGEYLKDHPHVKKYRWGEEGEGGMGVTIAELRA